MPDNKTIPQPGPAFYDAFVAGLRLHGTNFQAWSKARGRTSQNTKGAAMGVWDGPVSKSLRAEMVETVGQELFELLYQHRERILAEAA